MSVFKPYNYKNRPETGSSPLRKNRFFVFWEIYFRKFWRFISLNLIYFLICLPILMYVYVAVSGYLATVMGDAYVDLLPGVGFLAAIVLNVPKFLYLPLVVLSALLYGPMRMGFTYVYRNFTREEHAWVSDVWSKALENWKQGLALGILDLLISLVLINNIFGGITAEAGAVNVILLISRYLSIVLLLLFLFIRHYSYLIAVSVELPLRAVLKNSALFIVMGLGRNLISTLVCLLIWIISLLTVPLLTVIALPLLTYSLCGFATVYTCYPTVKKYLIVPAMEQEKEATE